MAFRPSTLACPTAQVPSANTSTASDGVPPVNDRLGL
jgi:hypothetical protein